MKVAFTDVDQQSVNGRTARAVNRTTGEVHTVTIAGGEADFGQLTYQQAYEVYGVNAGGTRSTQIFIKTETTDPGTPPEPPQSAPSLSATAISATRIDLTIGGVSGATGYEYRVDGGAPVDTGTNQNPAVTGLTPETQYSFEARAYNAEGSGPWSSAVVESTEALEEHGFPLGDAVFVYDSRYGRYSDPAGTTPAGIGDAIIRWDAIIGDRHMIHDDRDDKQPPTLVQEVDGVVAVKGGTAHALYSTVPHGGEHWTHMFALVGMDQSGGSWRYFQRGGISVGNNPSGQFTVVHSGTTSSALTSPSRPPSRSVVTFQVSAPGDVMQLYINGAMVASEQITATALASDMLPKLFGESSGHILGAVAMASFDRILTTNERESVEAWMADLVNADMEGGD